jgi:outer membrane protein assembly factor BamA
LGNDKVQANGLKIDAGLEAIRKAYWKMGFVRVKVGTAPQFEDSTQRVTYHISIDEGRRSGK